MSKGRNAKPHVLSDICKPLNDVLQHRAVSLITPASHGVEHHPYHQTLILPSESTPVSKLPSTGLDLWDTLLILNDAERTTYHPNNDFLELL